MKLSNRSIRVKELIKNELCIGTYGLVEIELKDFDKEKQFLESEIERLKKSVTYWFNAVNDLDCDKAKSKLHWQRVVDLETALEWIVQWYRCYYAGEDVLALSEHQLEEFQKRVGS